jgi:hypothetical protein
LNTNFSIPKSKFINLISLPLFKKCAYIDKQYLLVKFMTYHLLASFCILSFNGSRKDLFIFKQHYKLVISILIFFQNFIPLVHSFIHSFLPYFLPFILSSINSIIPNFQCSFLHFILLINNHFLKISSFFPSIHPFFQFHCFFIHLFVTDFISLGLIPMFFVLFLYSPSVDYCGTLENSNFQLKQSFIQFEYSCSVHVQNIQILTKIFQFFKF